jgi:hypothetical protein
MYNSRTQARTLNTTRPPQQKQQENACTLREPGSAALIKKNLSLHETQDYTTK